jgi:hypothetical protein
MHPDWNDDFAAPTVDDRIVSAFELTMDQTPPPRKMTLVVEPPNSTGSMSDRGIAVATILKRTHASTATFLNVILNRQSSNHDVEELRVDLKNLLENHRSALEYVAHYMAEKCMPVPRPKDVQFPVAKPSDDPVTFGQKLNLWFPGLASKFPALTTHLISIQPFNTEQWLYRLSEITNYHKHHSLPKWESAMFESIVVRVGDNGLRVGEMGFQSIELKPSGKILFPLDDTTVAELSGPCTLDASTATFPLCDPQIVIEKQELELDRIRGASHSIAHEVWTISKNVFRTVHTICCHLSKP